MESILILIGMLVLAYFATKGNYERNKKKVVKKLYKGYTHTTFDYQLYNKINSYRFENALQLLSFSYRQSDVAYSHSKWMADNKTVNHDNMVDRSENFEEVYSEIVGYNFQDEEAFMKAWIASDKHNKKLLNNKAMQMGIASEKDDQGRIYVTVNFLEFE